jgi:hypothetical protein
VSPYKPPESNASYVDRGQIVVVSVALPILGIGSDKTVGWRAQRNRGMPEPKTPIGSLIIPIIVEVLTILSTDKEQPTQKGISYLFLSGAVATNYFCFVGANNVAIIYQLDIHRTRVGPLLVIICAFSGFNSLGSHGTTAFVESNDYDGAFEIFGTRTAGLGLLGMRNHL